MASALESRTDELPFAMLGLGSELNRGITLPTYSSEGFFEGVVVDFVLFLPTFFVTLK